MGRPIPALIAVLLSASVPLFGGPAAAQTCTCPESGAGAAVGSAGGAIASSGAGPTIVADEAPPSLPQYDQPPIPGSGYIWTPGYWAWNNYEYYWVPGTWVEPPQQGALWTPAYWGFEGGVYSFHRGYWGPQVGFYGGVNYGFGYGGRGYEGGHWDSGRFFYNRTVNNFGSARIENVYEHPEPALPRSDRPSFNGPGGETLRPTPEEEAVDRERHIPPTKDQIDHARTASKRSDLFVSANHGKPAIAATARPAAFTGSGSVRANEGGDLHHASAPEGGEPGETQKGAPPMHEPQLPPAVEPAHGLPSAPERQKEEAPRPSQPETRNAPNPEPPRAPGAAAPRPERERQEAPRPAAPNAEPQRTPGAAGERLPPGAERQEREPHAPPGGPPAQMERDRPGPQPGHPGAPGAQLEHRPGPSAHEHAPGEREPCDGPGQPKCR